jgi:hypothetical protein
MFEACMEFTKITNPLLIHLTHDKGVKQNCKMQAKKSYNGPKGQRAREGIKNDLYLLNSLTDKRDHTVKKINHIVKKHGGKVILVLVGLFIPGSIPVYIPRFHWIQPPTLVRISIGQFSTFMKNLWFCS